MADRINEGFVITDSIQVGEMEFVFGKLDSKTPTYVTWACKGGDYYFWGTTSLTPWKQKKTCWAAPVRNWNTRWSGGRGRLKDSPRSRIRSVNGNGNDFAARYPCGAALCL